MPPFSAMNLSLTHYYLSLLAFIVVIHARSGPLADPVQQANADDKISEIQEWAAHPVVVAAVAQRNAALPPELLAMNQETWETLRVVDPVVRGFAKSEAAALLGSLRTDWVAEAFLSDAQGRKVAFLAKPTNWCHAGMDKHEVPMMGKIWQGPLNIDESTGRQQVQISVPVFKDGSPIGSLVIGILYSELHKD